MKLTKQRLGLVLVLAAGATALVVDRVALRSEGGLQNAAAALIASEPAGPVLDTKAVTIDRSSASIADRLEKVAKGAVTGRNAFEVPWAPKPVVRLEAGSPGKPVTEEPKQVAPWKLTRVNEVDGRIAVVLDRTTLLKLGGEANKGLELVSASTKGGKPWAIVREVSTGTEFRLELDGRDSTSERH